MHNGSDGYRLFVVLEACVIEWPQSYIQRQKPNVNDIEFEIEVAMLDFDAEYEALVASHSVSV